MGQRYEWTTATPPLIDCVPPGEELGDQTTDTWTLALGDPHGTALAVEGDRDELIAFGASIIEAVRSTYLAEHVNALHLSEPEPGCPECTSW